MLFNELYEKYEGLLTNLKDIINQSQGRVLAEDPDELFSQNINFFVKSYLINICTYLEAYLQDVAFEHTSRITLRLKEASVPHNFIYWKLAKAIKDGDLEFKDADYSFNKKEIADAISGNPYKTIKAYRLIGIDLSSNEKFNEHKDLVNTIVLKRNSIIHHNDDASDISFPDLLFNITVLLDYMTSIKEIASSLNNE